MLSTSLCASTIMRTCASSFESSMIHATRSLSVSNVAGT